MALQARRARDAFLLEQAASAPTVGVAREIAEDSGRLRRGDHDLQEERSRTRRRLGEQVGPSSSLRPGFPEEDEELGRPHALETDDDDDDEAETDVIDVMVVAAPSADEDFEVEVTIVEEQESYSLEDPELRQWMLGEYAEDKLRAGMAKLIGLMRDFGVAVEIPLSSRTEEEVRGICDTPWVKRCSRLCLEGLCPASGGLRQALLLYTRLHDSEASQYDEHVSGDRDPLLPQNDEVLLRLPRGTSHECTDSRGVLPRKEHSL